MNRVCQWLTRLILSSLLLAGCGTLPGTRTTPETADPTPTRNTPAEATPSPEAEPTGEVRLSEPHAWDAKPVLVQLYTSPGFVPNEYAWSTMPDLVAYADGTVIVVRESYRDEISRRTVEVARVEPGELCALLGQIESYGFFDFEQADYPEPQITDNGTTHITVDAWRSNAIAAYALDFALYEPDYLPELEQESEPVPAALLPLSDTYQLLRTYVPTGLAPYQPEQVVLRIEEVEGELEGVDATAWPLAELPLKDLPTNTPEYGAPEARLSGEQAQQVYAVFAGEWVKYYSEGDKIYSLALRPLLPLETWRDQESWGHTPEYQSDAKTPISCAGGPLAPLATATATVPVPTSTPEPERSPTPSPADKAPPLEYVGKLGRRDDPGQFSFTSSLAVTAQGEVIVADSGNDRLQIFGLDGNLLRTVPLTRSFAYDMDALPDGTLLVADWLGDEIEVRSPTGEVLRTIADWPRPESATWPSDTIAFAATGSDGALYLAENSGNRVIILNADGSLREIWGGPEDKALEEIRGLAIAGAGDLYVVLTKQNRIVRRDAAGQVEEFTIESPGTIAALSDGSFYVGSAQSIAYYDAGGTLVRKWEDGDLYEIEDLELAPDGSLVVLDNSGIEPQEGLVRRYDTEGRKLASFGVTTLQPGQVDTHTAFSASARGDVWLVDTGSMFSEEPPGNRLVHIDAEDRHLQTFDSIKGLSLGCQDQRLAALADGSVVFADLCTARVTHVDQSGQVGGAWDMPAGAGAIADMKLAPDERSLYILDEAGTIVQIGLDGAELARWDAGQLGVEQPIALAVDGQGGFFLLDEETREIVARPATGEATSWQLPDRQDGLNSIDVDVERQRVYVGGTDTYLYVFDWQGAYLGREEVDDSQGVKVQVGPGGRVYRSGGFHHIQIYEPTG